MITRILNLIHKELIQFRRDHLLTPFIILGPVLQMVMLASATATDATNLSFAVLDGDHSATSRQLIAAFENSTTLILKDALDSAEEARYLIDDEEIDLVLIIPPSFSADLMSATRRPEIQVIIDGTNSLVAGTLSRTAQGVLAHFQTQQLAAAGIEAASTGGIDLSTVAYYNQRLDFRHSALPAQLGLIVYMVTMLVASLGIARERERGTMEQLTVAPIRKIELMVGKATPVLVIALVDFVIMLAMVTSVYQIPLRGSTQLLIGLTMLYIAVEMSVGLIVSSVSRSQQQSLLVVFLIGVMNIAFSGYIVPVENMPWLLGKLSNVFPVQHYMTILRGIMLKGAGLPALRSDVLALVALGIVMTTSAYVVLQRRLD